MHIHKVSIVQVKLLLCTICAEICLTIKEDYVLSCTFILATVVPFFPVYKETYTLLQ